MDKKKIKKTKENRAQSITAVAEPCKTKKHGARALQEHRKEY